MDKPDDLGTISAHEGRIFGLARDYANGQRVDTHAHAHGQLLYALSGMIVAQAAARLWAAPPTRVLWIPPQVPHRFQTYGETLVRSVYLPERAAAALPDHAAALEVSGLARALMERSASAAATAHPDTFALRAVALLVEELRLAGDRSASLSLAMPSSRGARAFARLVLAQPAETPSLDTLARRVGLSARTLSRRMVAETGLTPDAWRQRARLLEALSRLELGETIARVASDLGYASPSSFGTAFRRAFGMTPARARRNVTPPAHTR